LGEEECRSVGCLSFYYFFGDHVYRSVSSVDVREHLACDLSHVGHRVLRLDCFFTSCHQIVDVLGAKPQSVDVPEQVGGWCQFDSYRRGFS
jgi:hypothetical protein